MLEGVDARLPDPPRRVLQQLRRDRLGQRRAAQVRALAKPLDRGAHRRRPGQPAHPERGDQADDTVTAFIDVSVAPARSVGFDDVAVRISRFPEVRSVYLVSGGHDLRCTVTGGSIRAVSDFVSQKLSTIDRVQSTATHFVLKAYKRGGVAFTEAEPDHRLPVTP